MLRVAAVVLIPLTIAGFAPSDDPPAAPTAEQAVASRAYSGQIFCDNLNSDTDFVNALDWLDGVAAAEPPATQPAQADPQPQVRPAAPVPAGRPVLSVRTVDRQYGQVGVLGLTVTGQADEPGSLELNAAGQRIFMPVDHVVRVYLKDPPEREQAPTQRMPDNASAVLLANGEWLVGLISGGDERRLLLAVSGLGELSVPLRRVRGIVTPAGRTGQSLAQLERMLQAGPPPGPAGAPVHDTLLLANGEVISGTVVAVRPEGLAVQGPLGELNVEMDVLLTARLVNPLPPPPSADAPPAAWVELTNGSRLLAERLAWDNATFRVSRPGQSDPLLIPDPQVAAVEIVNGRWQWLDAMTPLLNEHRPFLTVRWPARFGVNVVGGPLRLGERTFRHGIGVHSASRLVFAAAGSSRFVCLAGLDAAASGPLADVDVQVLVDGRVRFEKQGVKAADPPLRIDLDLSGAQKLELRVELGAHGDVQDRFNWADAALIR